MGHRRQRSACFHTLPLTLTTLAALLDLLAAPPAAVAQASDQQLFLSVVDRKGLPITDLAPEEISVEEDGVTCEVRFLMPATEPADLAILVDTSGAVVSATAHIREALHEFVGMLEGRARMSLMTFGDLPRQYVLTYVRPAPPKVPEDVKIRVRVKRSGVDVRITPIQ